MQSCGSELAEDAVVPEQLAALMRHVAENLLAHARWVGSEGAEARREHDGLLRVAEDYRGIAAAAERAATTMRALRDVPAAPHDEERWDRAAFAAWLRRKIELQRAFAELILEHARVSERVLEGSPWEQESSSR